MDFFGKEFRDHLEDERSEGVHSYIKFQQISKLMEGEILFLMFWKVGNE